jgi:cytochrome P450
MIEVHRAIAELIRQARDRLEREPALREAPSNLLEAMLVACDRPGAGLSEYDVASNVLTMLLAGEDTTANTIAWLVYLVNRNAGVAQRLSDEAERVLGEDRFASQLELAPAHTYAAACAQETMRLKPVAPMLVLQAMRPTVVGDIAVPAGTGVMALMRCGAIDARHFERPEAFYPDRWLDSQAGAVGTAGRERVSMPFGGGPRICPGRNLAMLEISLVTSMLYRNFDVIAVRTPDGGEAKELMAFTMGPSRLMVTLAHRK